MENEENQKPVIKSYYEQQVERMENEKIWKQRWKEEIENSETLNNYFKDFQPGSVTLFIDSYIMEKTLWFHFGEFYKTNNETEQLEWETRAFKELGFLQQKKLFDMQCLWRAEKITIPGIEICFDFEIWEEDILNCPFIDPISEADIELYSQYLEQDNAEKNSLYGTEGWQNYEEIKEAYNTDNSNVNFPEWYDFYNGRRGTGALMLLPDLRGPKEEFYQDLYFDSVKEETQARQAEWDAVMDKRPSLEYYKHKFVEWFVNTFEDKETRELYTAYKWGTKNNGKEEQIHNNIRLLLKAEEFVPIEAHYNWIEALEKAANRYTLKKIAEALPLAFERYCINLQTGISFHAEHFRKSLRHLYKERIIAGRVLNGEPADLNF